MNGNSNLSDLKLSRDHFAIKGLIDKDNRAFMRAELPEPGIVEITDIFRGRLPQGSGGDFIAATLAGHHAIPTKKLIFKNIENAATKEAFITGIAPSETVLGRTGKKALEKLGLIPANYSFAIDRGKLKLIIDVA